jgi:hypothetical protein
VPCLTPYYPFLKKFNHVDSVRLNTAVPCGRCPPCKERRVKQWAFRLQKEYDRSIVGHFITLTYNTETVPITGNGYMTLRKKDFQDFMKRLRKLVSGSAKSNVKYYAAGEYGTLKQRPHYHAIVFNVEDEELYSKAWTHGVIDIGPVNKRTIAYTCKYINKDGKIWKPNDDRDKEFSLMSKRLGDNYIEDKQTARYHQSDILENNFCITDEGYKIPLPRYYRDKLFTDDEKKLQATNVKLQVAEEELKDRERFFKIYKNNPEELQNYMRFVHYRNAAIFQRFDKQQKIRDL